MNSTNRAANRLFLGIVGIVLVIVGAGAIVLGSDPDVARAWRSGVSSGRRQADSVFGSTLFPGSTVSWAGVGVLAVLVALIVVLVVFIARQGRGRTGTALAVDDPENTVRIDTSAVRDVIDQQLDGDPRIITHAVSAHLIRRERVLKISATCRRGVAPTDARDLIERALGALDDALGVQLPALIELDGGFRARVGSRARLT
jgi:hypothetical protein